MFLEEFRRLGLFSRGSAVLDIGCGCGRLAYTLATDQALRELEVSYAGMDVDRSSIEWCRRHITPRNPRFVFYHADCYNPSYNPGGTIATVRYRFPHADSSLDVVLLTSVLTHVLEEDLRHYLAEVFRLLAPGGIAYASFFLYQNAAEAAAGMDRHGLEFPFCKGHLSLNREDYPTNAVAYDEAFVRSVVRETGLRVMEPARYSTQDLLLLERPRPSSEDF